MLAMNSSLSAERITSLARTAATVMAFEVVAETGSTNADLYARLASLARPVLRVAERQIAGRGRAGRQWLAAPGESLCFSLAWPFSGPLAALAGLPLAVGVVLAETLAAMGWPVGLKWPNDLMKGGAKLGGILIEAARVPGEGGAAAQTWAVIGAGLNVFHNQQLSDAVGGHITALADEDALAPPPDREALLAALADALAAALPQFDRQGLAPFAQRWSALHVHQDQMVVILEGGAIAQQGIARGIDATGRLLLDTASGQQAVSAGDVSLRPADTKEQH